jgi:hypothetical protein
MRIRVGMKFSDGRPASHSCTVEPARAHIPAQNRVEPKKAAIQRIPGNRVSYQPGGKPDCAVDCLPIATGGNTVREAKVDESVMLSRRKKGRS